MITLAKITTLAIILLLVTYFVVFYAPVIKKFTSPQEILPTPIQTEIPTNTPTLIPKITTIPTSTPIILQPTVAKPTPIIDSRCIITADGARYDVTQFRNIHSGGDIFQCGTDMSIIFHNRHSNSFLQQMALYKLI